MPPESRFHVWALAHPRVAVAAHDQVQRRLTERHALFCGKPTPFSLSPFLLSHAALGKISRICEALAEILETAGRVVLRDQNLIRAYAFPPHFPPFLGIDPGYDRLAPVLRLDGHFVRGVFRLVETNADGSAGMNDSNALERSALETDLYASAFSGVRLRSLDMVGPLARMLISHARAASRRGLPERIGILDLPGMSTESEFVAIKAAIEEAGGRAIILHPRDLRYGRFLAARGRAVGVVYRRLVTRDAWDHWHEIAPLLFALRDRRVRLVGSFRSEILHSKAILAALHDPGILAHLRPAERALSRRHVPEARVLTAAVAERAVRLKDRWVLKPLDAYGSRDVSIGRMMGRRPWLTAVRRAVRSGRFLLQEYVPATIESVMRITAGAPVVAKEMTSVGFFLYDGKFAGPYVRSGPAHPLSISRGAVTRPGFVRD